MAFIFSRAIALSLSATFSFLAACSTSNRSLPNEVTTDETPANPEAIAPDTVSTSPDSPDTSAAPSTPPASSDSSNHNMGISASAPLSPGTYCFQFNDGVLDSIIRLTVNADASVTGQTKATIQDYENSYFTSYEQMLVGTLEDTQLHLNVTTAIEQDTQQTQEVWQLTDTRLSDERHTHTSIDCARADAEPLANVASPGDSGLEALGVDPSQLMAPIRVQFAPGASSAEVENSVVRGTRDVYVLGARENQVMTLSITSLEDNAVFDVLSPNDEVLRREAISEEIVLPESGDYRILVGGTRGNASYQLAIAIR